MAGLRSTRRAVAWLIASRAVLAGVATIGPGYGCRISASSRTACASVLSGLSALLATRHQHRAGHRSHQTQHRVGQVELGDALDLRHR